MLLTCGGMAIADPSKPDSVGPWKYGAVVSINLSQSTFSSNWAGGDKGTIAWVANSDLSAKRQFSPTFNLSNVLQLAYGQTSEQFEDANGNLAWDVPDKSTDLISFESVGRFTLSSIVDPYFALRLDSQFRDLDNPLGELKFNPIKVKESVGVARVLEKTEDSEIITRIGFGFRQTFAQTFGTSTQEKVRFTSNDGGFEWQTGVTQPLLDKKVLYKGQLLIYAAIFYSNADDLESFDAQAITAFSSASRSRTAGKDPGHRLPEPVHRPDPKALSVNRLFAQLV